MKANSVHKSVETNKQSAQKLLKTRWHQRCDQSYLHPTKTRKRNLTAVNFGLEPVYLTKAIQETNPKELMR